jgi:hypothetical protein
MPSPKRLALRLRAAVPGAATAQAPLVAPGAQTIAGEIWTSGAKHTVQDLSLYQRRRGFQGLRAAAELIRSRLGVIEPAK